MLPIRKGVPIPGAIRTSVPGRRKYPFETMEKGDFFFVPNKEKNTLASHASTVGHKLKRKFETRLCYMVKRVDGWENATDTAKNAVLGIGCWRTK